MPKYAWNRPKQTPISVPDEAVAAGPWETIGFSRLTAAAASVSFAPIPTQYTMFRLQAEIINDANAKTVNVRLNNDSGANYDHQRLTGNGVTVASARTTGATSMPCNDLGTAGASTFITVSLVIGKPLTTTKGLIISNAVYTSTNLNLEDRAAIWNNTANLISRIDVLAAANNFAIGSLFVLQGSRY